MSDIKTQKMLEAYPGAINAVLCESELAVALSDAFRGLSKCYEPPTIWAMRSDHFKRLKSRKMRWMMRVEKRKNRKRAARKRARKGGR